VGNLFGLRRALLLAATGLILTSTLQGCDSSPPEGEVQMLAGAGIGVPVQGATWLGGRGNLANLQSDNDYSRTISSLVDGGVLTIVPDTSGPPWWKLAIQQGQADGFGNFSFPLGYRNVVSKHDQRSWSDGATKYFAETVDYEVKLNGNFKTGQAVVGPFSVRLVLVDDPAAGGWQVSPQSNLSAFSADQRAAQALIAQAGDSRKLQAALADAARQANDQLAAQVSQSTGLKAASNAGVVRKPDVQLAFMVPDGELADQATFATAKSTCASSQVSGLHWHLASRAEAEKMTFTSNGALAVDTPNSSIWGTRLNGVFVLILDGWSSTAPLNMDAPVGMTPRWYLQLTDLSGAHVKFDTEWPDSYGHKPGDVVVSWKVNDGKTHRKPLCVASI
jgi:hypothetical protein